jgi:carbon-monoxide dehydrogenase iron sulfur subunit
LLALKVDASKCNGCGLCRIVCSFYQGIGVAGSPFVQEQLPEPLVQVQESAGQRQISLCRHCEKPVCVDGCVAGALLANPDLGTVILDQQKCVGCYSCVMECPFGALQMKSGQALKCDGCKMMPLCARYCPAGALQADRDSHMAAARRRRKRMGSKSGSPSRAAFRR